MTLLGGVQRRYLPGQIVVPRSGAELVDAHRHNPERRTGSTWRSAKPGEVPVMHGVYRTSDFGFSRGTSTGGGGGLAAEREPECTANDAKQSAVNRHLVWQAHHREIGPAGGKALGAERGASSCRWPPGMTSANLRAYKLT
jgi:hypothetical protein